MQTTTNTANRIVTLLLLICLFVLPSCQNNRILAKKELANELAARQQCEAESLLMYHRAVESYDHNDLKKARQHLTEALGKYDRNAQAWMMLGLIDNQEDRAFEAASDFHRASLLAPDRYEPVYNIGMLLETFGRYDQAMDTYQAALKLSPNQLEVMENLARCYVRTSTHYEKAKDLIDRCMVLEQRPNWQEWLHYWSGRLRPGRTIVQ